MTVRRIAPDPSFEVDEPKMDTNSRITSRVVPTQSNVASTGQVAEDVASHESQVFASAESVAPGSPRTTPAARPEMVESAMHPIWERADGRRLLLNPHLGTAKEFKALSEVNHSFRHHLFEAKRSTRVTNERQLAILSQRFPRVRCVTLDRLNLSGRDLGADLPQGVREVALTDCHSNDARWAESLRTVSLQRLTFSGLGLYRSSVCAEVIEHLRHVGTLRHLEFRMSVHNHDVSIMRSWMEGIARLSSLQTLALPTGNYYSGYSEWQPVCAGVPQLQYLIVPANNADVDCPEHLLTLMGFSQLRALDLSKTTPSKQVLEAIAQLPRLQALSVRVDSKASAHKILTRCTSLEVLHLNMHDIGTFSDADELIRSLASLPNLRDLVVGGQIFGPDEVRALRDIRSLRSLSVRIDESCMDDPELAQQLNGYLNSGRRAGHPMDLSGIVPLG